MQRDFNRRIFHIFENGNILKLKKIILYVIMIHYEIDFKINNEWHHTFGDSTFPSDSDFENDNYTDRDIIQNAEIIIHQYMKKGHLIGYVSRDNIRCSISILNGN